MNRSNSFIFSETDSYEYSDSPNRNQNQSSKDFFYLPSVDSEQSTSYLSSDFSSNSPLFSSNSNDSVCFDEFWLIDWLIDSLCIVLTKSSWWIFSIFPRILLKTNHNQTLFTKSLLFRNSLWTLLWTIQSLERRHVMKRQLYRKSNRIQSGMKSELFKTSL